MNGGVVVHVQGTRVVRLAVSAPVAAKVLPGPVLMLVGSAAGLIEGDEVHIELDLAPGAALTVLTTAATIAHPCPAGGSTRLSVECRLGAGARLTWLPEPLIACAGCNHSGRARVALGTGATATWLESVTLGRSGEQPGRVRQRLDVEIDGHALLREGLSVGGTGGGGWDGPAVVGPNRHVAALHLLGRRVSAADGESLGVLQLAGPGTTTRFVAGRADELARQVTAALPLFLGAGRDPALSRTADGPKEALQV